MPPSHVEPNPSFPSQNPSPKSQNEQSSKCHEGEKKERGWENKAKFGLSNSWNRTTSRILNTHIHTNIYTQGVGSFYSTYDRHRIEHYVPESLNSWPSHDVKHCRLASACGCDLLHCFVKLQPGKGRNVLGNALRNIGSCVIGQSDHWSI